MTLINKKKYLLVFSLIIIVDQASKIIIQSVFKGNPYREIKVIADFFSLRYVENKGAVWGIFSQSGNKVIPIIITSLSLIALAVVLYFFLKLQSQCALELTALSFIIGGAVGNIIDRLYQGYVVDFFDVYIKTHHWPTFNVADSFISVGVVFLIISIWRGKCTQF
ncbi:MAG: signal peptidase II [bacterium]|nr:signal peptidase II [bacterium]